MSTGHLKYETKPEAETLAIIGERDTAERKAKPVKVDSFCDVPYAGGMSIDGKTVYIDRHFYREIMDGRIEVRGMTSDQIVQAIIEHEHTEKAILDGDNPCDTYPAAHEYATTSEHDFVSKLGVDPERYEASLEQAIRRCLRRVPAQPPIDLWCGPILDDPTAEDKRILSDLRRRGVRDAFKLSKEEVRYSIGAERCEDCKMMQRPDRTLSECDLVSGLVRNNRRCDRFEAR